MTDAVLATIDCDNPRSQKVLSALVKYVHDFIREIEPTEAEWMYAVDFLTRTGHKCDGERQEYMLMSDVLKSIC